MVKCFRVKTFLRFVESWNGDKTRGLASNMGESSVEVSNSNRFGAGYWIGEFSSLLLIGRQISGGFLDNASAFAFALLCIECQIRSPTILISISRFLK